MLEVDIPLLFILSMTLSMLGPSTRRHCACALGGILISETIKLLVTLCDRGGVTRHTALGTDGASFLLTYSLVAVLITL